MTPDERVLALTVLVELNASMRAIAVSLDVIATVLERELERDNMPEMQP